MDRDRPVSRSLRRYRRLLHYPSAWRSGLIQRVMLKWSGNRCECCGEMGGVLVHHLVWELKGDCRFENLLVCCLGCHVRLHNREWQPGKVWLWGEIPEWQKIRGMNTPLIRDAVLNVSDRVPALMWLMLLGVSLEDDQNFHESRERGSD